MNVSRACPTARKFGFKFLDGTAVHGILSGKQKAARILSRAAWEAPLRRRWPSIDA
jgi:hypothetical protein